MEEMQSRGARFCTCNHCRYTCSASSSVKRGKMSIRQLAARLKLCGR